MDSSVRSSGLGLQSAASSNGDVVVNIADLIVPNPSRRIETNEIEANCLEEIDAIPRLKLILADWESKYKESRQRIDRKESLNLNVKNEIYNLIGFFSVFQGVVLTTVSQASALTCRNWWGPFALSLLCSLATLFGVCHKFYNFLEWKRAIVVELGNSKVLKNQIHSLKKYGRRFDFSLHAPDQDNQKEQEKKKKNNSWRHLIFNRYFIIAFLVVHNQFGIEVEGIPMGRLHTILENGTNSPFEVRSESSSGVHALLSTLKPQDTYKLFRSSSDTYLQHWVVMGDAPVVSFSSDELIDNQRITIVCASGELYRKVVVPRHTPKSISMHNRNSEPVAGESPTQTLPNAGKPPSSGFKRFWSSLTRRGSSSEIAASSSASPSSLRSVGSSPM